MSKIPSDDVLERLYKLRILESAQLKTVLELYDMEIHQKISMPNYQKLKTMVKRSLNQKLRLRNFDARHGRIETGAVIKNRKGMNGVEGGKCIWFQWKEKGQCSKGDKCSSRHEGDERARKPTPKAATPSEPSMTRGKSMSSGMILRQPCRYYLKGTCVGSPCEYWHPPECQFYRTQSGCKAGDKCLFPHNKIDEEPKKKHQKSDRSHTGRESEDTSVLAIVNTVPQRGCASQDSESLKSEGGAESRGNPMQNFFETNSTNTIHTVYATSSKYPGK